MAGQHDDTIPASSPPEAAVGDEDARTGDRYRLGAELGRGGMGRVVEAFDTQLGRTVALKEVLPRSPAGAARRFAREVQITARLEHASIVPLYDSGTTPDGRPYYVMRKVSGRPLDELIARAPALEERLALLPNVLSAIEAIAHAHRRGVIHRDLKPANILVGDLGETVVIDWGLAKVIGEDDDAADRETPRIPVAADSLQTQLGSVFGTPGFMPPEQARGDELGPRSDVFALGATLYTLLVGKPPVGGKSATEMIEATHKHAIVPVAQAAPGTPPELVAIVEKALAHEPSARYANAGALAEDVRRFSTGQLVAAHRYTRRERLARFARRHRAVLGVSALGLSTVAVLAWVGVHRIVAERDAATHANELAQQEKREVDRVNRELADQLDQVRVEQARSMVAQNPTKAIAVLKELRPTYSKDDARAVAQAATRRGVAWALATGSGPPLYGELDQSGTRVVEATIPGELRMFDLDARRIAWSHTYRRGARGSFVDDGKGLLVLGPGGPAQLVDPRDGTARADTLPEMQWGVLDARGTRVLYRDARGGAGLYDVSTHEVRVVTTERVHELAIGRDASWYAVTFGKELVVYDRDGKELVRRPVSANAVVTSGKRKLAVLDDREVLELELDPAPKWTPLHVPLDGPARVLVLAYRDDRLVAQTTSAAYLMQAKDTFARVPGDPGLSWGLTIAADAAVAISADGQLHYEVGFASGSLVLPTSVPSPHLIGRAGLSRLAIAGEGILVVYDLSDVIPHYVRTPHGGNAAFAGDDLLLVHDQTPNWLWYDVAADKLIDAEIPEWAYGDNYLLDSDGERRALRTANAGDGNRLSILRPGQPDRVLSTLPMGPAMHQRFPPRVGALVPGDAVVFAEGARVMAAVGGETPREVAKVDGEPVAMTHLGRLRFAVLSQRGELLRGHVDGNDIERAHVELHDTAILAPDRDGHALVASGKQLLVWDTDVRELARFEHTIVFVAAADGGVVVELADRQLLLVPPSGAPRRLMTVGSQPPSVAGDGKLVVAPGNGSQIEVVELPSGASWTLAMASGSIDHPLALSPTTRRLANASGSLAVWTLPEPKTALHDWLSELTNACLAGDVLAWPWESKCSP